MDTITINGLGAPFDGTYEMGARERPLTTLEWRWIKKISGYLPDTFEEGFRGRDPDLFVALAVIGLIRNGKATRDQALNVAALFDDSPAGAETIRYEGGEDDPPADAQNPTSPDGSGSDSNGSSGSASAAATESQESTPPATGSPSSATTSTSGLETSTT